MQDNIQLFLNGIEVDLNAENALLFNFKQTDVDNPTAVRNSWSRSIALQGTASNNVAMGYFYINDSNPYMGFNPTKKCPFTIYRNADIAVSGYAQLAGVRNVAGEPEYTLNLFGGLGQFLYNLTFSQSDEATDAGKLSLADLAFLDGSESELDFAITKDTVAEAWQYLDIEGNGKFNILNFAPCYNGLPSDFDADKVLVNGVNGVDINREVATGGTTYRPYAGYVLAEMSAEHTESEMRDYRSYLQRPVIKVSKVIEAICNARNNGGYQVNLDPDFFRSDNPYWSDTYMTLPMLTELEGVQSAALTGVTGTLSGAEIRGGYNERRGFYQWATVTLSGTEAEQYYTVSMDLNVDFIPNRQYIQRGNLMDLNYWYNLDINAYSCMTLQLLAYDQLGNIITGSTAINMTSVAYPESGYMPNIDLWGYKYDYGNKYINSVGLFGRIEPVGTEASRWRWNQKISLQIANVPANATLKLICRKYGAQRGIPFMHYLNMATWEADLGPGVMPEYTECDGFIITANAIEVGLANEDGVRSGALVTKRMLLSTDYSPADFLLSYLKAFGLYMRKDKYENKIDILTRGNYFKTDSVADISEKIDFNEINIKPVLAETKWYDLRYADSTSEFGDNYKSAYGVDYGIQRINTGYAFNAEVKNLLESSIFSAGVEVLEKNKYNAFIGDNISRKPWMLDGFEYSLYNTTNIEDTTGLTVDATSTLGILEPFDPRYKWYDIISMLQAHGSDNSAEGGNNVLLFYNGKQECVAGAVDLGFYLTDDSIYMTILNGGNPCWIATNSEYDEAGNHIALHMSSIPQFGRYKIAMATGNIYKSLDFGETRQLYIPYARTNADSTIYAQYWRNYIADLYSPATRQITCKMLLHDADSDMLRNFYWYDRCIWRINAIEDYDIAGSDLTKVELIKVNDINNYKDIVDEEADIEMSANIKNLTYIGGDVSITVTCAADTEWYLQMPDFVQCSITGGTGTQTFTVTIGENAGNTRIAEIAAIGRFDSASVSVVQSARTLEINRYKPTGETVPYVETLVELQIMSSTPWTATASGAEGEWIISGGTGGVLTRAQYRVSENTGAGDRLLAITVRNESGAEETVLYRQNAISSPYITLTPFAAFVDGAGHRVSVHVDANVAWQVTEVPQWVTIIQTDTDRIVYEAEQNTGAERTGVIVFEGGGVRATHSITQSEDMTLQLYYNIPSNGVVEAIGGDIYVNMISYSNWTASVDRASIDVLTPAGPGRGSQVQPIRLRAHALIGQMTFTLTVTNATATKTLQFTQGR